MSMETGTGLNSLGIDMPGVYQVTGADGGEGLADITHSDDED